MLELLVESAVLGAIGGAIGLLGGWALTSALNSVTETAQNLDLFLLTPRLALAVPLFAIGLGLAAGLPPAIRAARLDPAVALRAQD